MKKILLSLSALSLLSMSAIAQHKVESNGKKYSVLEESTGAWCQYCTDGTAQVDAMTTANPQALAVANHYGDAMQIADYKGWEDNIYGSGWPGATIDRKKVSGSFKIPRNQWPTYSQTVTSGTPKFDVMVEHTWDAATKTISITVTATALEDYTGKLSFNAYVTEDKVTGSGSGYDQKNAYNGTAGHPFQGKGNPIVGFEHNHTTRALLGGAFGDNDWTDPKKDDKKSATYTYTLKTGEDETEMHIIGFIAMNGASYDDKEILNAMEARVFPWATGINNVAQISDMSVYPNPANNFINVKSHLVSAAPTTVTISSLVGQVVYSQEFAQTNNLFSENISVANLNSGVYMVTLSSNGTQKTQKLVINK